MGVQACHLPGLQPLKRLKTLKTLQKLQKRLGTPNRADKSYPPRPHPWLLLGGPACHSLGVTCFKPFKRLNIVLACLLPQPTGTPRPHQWLLMGVQACCLPGLKHLKGLNPLNPSKASKTSWNVQPRRQKLPPKATSMASCGPACHSPGVTCFKPFKRLNIVLACLLPQPTGTPRPHQWLLMGVQACRLPGLKPLKRLKTLKTLQKLQKRLGTPNRADKSYPPRPHPWLLLGGPACHSLGVTCFKPFKRLNIVLACLLPQPTGTPSRPHQWLLMDVRLSKPAACQALNSRS